MKTNLENSIQKRVDSKLQFRVHSISNSYEIAKLIENTSKDCHSKSDWKFSKIPQRHSNAEMDFQLTTKTVQLRFGLILYVTLRPAKSNCYGVTELTAENLYRA